VGISVLAALDGETTIVLEADTVASQEITPYLPETIAEVDLTLDPPVRAPVVPAEVDSREITQDQLAATDTALVMATALEVDKSRINE